MSGKMLTTWSEEYVNALFKSELAGERRIGRFRQRTERVAFIEGMAARRAVGVEVESFPDGLGVRINGAGPDDLLDIVKLARQCGGEIVFPGALPA